MPEYRIGLQYGVSPNAAKREHRSYHPPYVPGATLFKQIRKIYASSPVSALLKLNIELNREGENPHIRETRIEKPY